MKRNCKTTRGSKYRCIGTQSTDESMSGAPASHEEVVASQALYIDNLQQQVYFLESEIGYLRNHLDHASRLQPTMFAEAEKMVKKLSETQKEVENLKVEKKRYQTAIDLLKSEKERLGRKIEDNEAAFYRQKCSFLGEIVELKKQNDEYSEKSLELERAVQEGAQQENHLQGERDGLRVQVEELQKELAENKKIIECLQEEKKELQKSLFEASMHLEMKSAVNQEEAVNLLKTEVQDLHKQLSTAGRTAEHEKLLRSRLAEDNECLIKRNANTEAELAEIKAKFREEKNLKTSLEELHLKVVLEASETKSEAAGLIAEIETLKGQLKSEKDRSLLLATQVADEQRFKTREEQKVVHLDRQLEQKEIKIKAREKENTDLLRDNSALTDEILLLKEQLKKREAEVDNLKGKVQEMQVSVEEYIQSTEAATRLESQRWRQLNQLAHGIQAISKEAVIEKDV